MIKWWVKVWRHLSPVIKWWGNVWRHLSAVITWWGSVWRHLSAVISWWGSVWRHLSAVIPWWPEMEDMGLSFQIIAYAELTSQTGNLICQAIPQGQNSACSSFALFCFHYRTLAKTCDPSLHRLSELYPEYVGKLVMHILKFDILVNNLCNTVQSHYQITSPAIHKCLFTLPYQ